jgi:hypothetical protein
LLYTLLTSVPEGVGERHQARVFYPGKDPIPIVQETGWVPGPVWMCAKNLAPARIRYPDRPARSLSLYRLSYPGPHTAEAKENYRFPTNQHGRNTAFRKSLNTNQENLKRTAD